MKRTGEIHGNRLQQLRSEARLLQRLEQLVFAELPDEFAPHCISATLRDDTLTLFVTSGAWASRLRFHQNDLLNAISESLGVVVANFKVKVATKEREASVRKGAPMAKGSKPQISDTAGEALMQAAMGQSDPELAEVLARLASRARVPE